MNKSYSIQSGSYGGKKRATASGKYLVPTLVGAGVGALGGAVNASQTGGDKKIGALIGGALGAGLGALFRLLYITCDKSSFNTGTGTGSAYKLLDTLDQYIIQQTTDVSRSTTSSSGRTTDTVTTRGRQQRPLEGVAYDIDQDPRKYPISIAYEGDVMLFILHKINDRLLRLMNDELDTICHKFKNADYISYPIGKDDRSWVVELKIVGDSYWYIPYDLYSYGIKFNVLTMSNISAKSTQKFYSITYDNSTRSFELK